MKCTTPEQYEIWLQLARKYGPGQAGFCADCTPGYQARMKVEGRCERPEVWFDDEGGRIGKREDAPT